MYKEECINLLILLNFNYFNYFRKNLFVKFDFCTFHEYLVKFENHIISIIIDFLKIFIIVISQKIIIFTFKINFQQIQTNFLNNITIIYLSLLYFNIINLQLTFSNIHSLKEMLRN